MRWMIVLLLAATPMAALAQNQTYPSGSSTPAHRDPTDPEASNPGMARRTPSANQQAARPPARAPGDPQSPASDANQGKPMAGPRVP